MNERDFRRDIGKINRFIDRCIAAADDCHFTVTVEKTVTSSASRYPPSDIGLLRWQSQILCRRTRGDDERIAGIFPHIADQPDRLGIQFGRMNLVEFDPCFETFGMFKETLHQIRSRYALSVPWPVFDFRSRHQLSALLQSCNQKRFEIGSCRINRCGITGRAGSQNDHIGMYRRSCHSFTIGKNRNSSHKPAVRDRIATGYFSAPQPAPLPIID